MYILSVLIYIDFCVKLYPLHSCQMYIHFILSPLVGSGSPNNSDDDQKMNNFIEKGTVFFFSFL